MKKLIPFLGVILSACGGGAGGSASLATVADDGIRDYRVVISNGASAHSLKCTIWDDYHLGAYTDRSFGMTPFAVNSETEVASFSSANFFLMCDALTNNAGPFPQIKVYEDGVLWNRVDILNFASSVTLRDGVLCDANGTATGACTSYNNGG
jgi:hypothetical protein